MVSEYKYLFFICWFTDVVWDDIERRFIFILFFVILNHGDFTIKNLHGDDIAALISTFDDNV